MNSAESKNSQEDFNFAIKVFFIVFRDNSTVSLSCCYYVVTNSTFCYDIAMRYVAHVYRSQSSVSRRARLFLTRALSVPRALCAHLIFMRVLRNT